MNLAGGLGRAARTVTFLDARSTKFKDEVDPARIPRLTPPYVRQYLTYMRTTISSKGQIVLPAEFRKMDLIKPGQEFEVERLERGDYRLVLRAAPPNAGAIDWLLACPQKSFFVPIPSESTDEL